METVLLLIQLMQEPMKAGKWWDICKEQWFGFWVCSQMDGLAQPQWVTWTLCKKNLFGEGWQAYGWVCALAS